MKEMKVNRLIKYLKLIKYKHKKWKNIEPYICCKIYESYKEKMKTMSKNKFVKYFQQFRISRWSILNIIEKWKKLKDPYQELNWVKHTKKIYKERYNCILRTDKTKNLNVDQTNYVVKLRKDEPNMGYKRFENKMIDPKEKIKYTKIFDTDKIISKRLFYNILKENNIPKRKTKRKKQWLLRKYKEANQLDTYLAKMKHIYCSYKALHHRQIDIKYLTDIPNYVWVWIFKIYHYQITFRDYKSWLCLVFYWNNRDKSRVYIATLIFENILTLMWVDKKKVLLQYDGWTEFSSIKQLWVEWKYIEYIKKKFKWYKIIKNKEENGHVEAFHRICEEEFFDTKKVQKALLSPLKISDKEKILKKLDKYIKWYNKYWYSSYKPRYLVFWKKSPIQIIKSDWWDKLDYNILENYVWAYDIDSAFRTKKINEYPLLINLLLNYKLKLGGQIWVGRYNENIILSWF